MSKRIPVWFPVLMAIMVSLAASVFLPRPTDLEAIGPFFGGMATGFALVWISNLFGPRG